MFVCFGLMLTEAQMKGKTTYTLYKIYVFIRKRPTTNKTTNLISFFSNGNNQQFVFNWVGNQGEIEI